MNSMRVSIAILMVFFIQPVFPQDELSYTPAISLLKQAAEQGDAMAQSALGAMYGTGQGVPQDYQESIHWFRLSADQGYEISQYNLGLMYRKGEGVPRDYKEAVRWFRLAADQGQPKAQASLGLMYYFRKGVPKDLVLAHMWANLAASRQGKWSKDQMLTSDGRQMSVKFRNMLEKQMTREQVAEAQRLAREFKPKPSKVTTAMNKKYRRRNENE